VPIWVGHHWVVEPATTLPFRSRGDVSRPTKKKLMPSLAVLRQVDRHPCRKIAVTFDPNQKWLRVVTNDNFFDFEPARPFGDFPPRRIETKRRCPSQTVSLGQSDTLSASR